MTESQFSSVKSIASCLLIRPALLTSISTLPYTSIAAVITLDIEFMSERSANTSVNIPPSASILALVSSHERLATPSTLAPACASAIHIPCPSPVLAPVTTATLLSNLNKSNIIYSLFPYISCYLLH